MTTSTVPSVASTPPGSSRVRGTVALVAGAGEPASVYDRFRQRIAADGYAIAVFETHRLEEAVQWLAGQTAPRVLAGSDRGAAAVLARVVEDSQTDAAHEDAAHTDAAHTDAAHTDSARLDGAQLDGVLLAGLPTGPDDDATAPVQARTACPVHLGVLADTRPAAITSPPVETPDAARLATVRVPVLAVHGGADPIAPLETVRTVLSSLADVDLLEAVDGLHDVLNDRSHRSVAATIVLWLERLRSGETDRPIVQEVAL